MAHPTGPTLIKHTTENNYHATAQILNQGANPNILSHETRAPLHIAAARNYHQIAELLIAHGANINILGNSPRFILDQKNRNNWTPLALFNIQ